MKSFGLLTYFLEFCVVFGLDRYTKFLALEKLATSDFEVIKGFCTFSLSLNRGVTGGVFSFDSNSNFLFLSFLILLIIISFCIYTFRLFSRGLDVFPQVLVISGALSNFLDRLLYGGVVDFIDLYIGTWHWPVFNIADSAIVIGVFLIIWRNFNHECYGKN